MLIATVLVSCGSNDAKTEPAAAAATEPTMEHMHDSTAAPAADYSNVSFDATKDFVCGMPIKAGVEDTAHYNGKVYGFCSKECKDEFAKSPESFLAKK